MEELLKLKPESQILKGEGFFSVLEPLANLPLALPDLGFIFGQTGTLPEEFQA